jgi:hypothetical protein
MDTKANPDKGSRILRRRLDEVMANAQRTVDSAETRAETAS